MIIRNVKMIPFVTSIRVPSAKDIQAMKDRYKLESLSCLWSQWPVFKSRKL